MNDVLKRFQRISLLLLAGSGGLLSGAEDPIEERAVRELEAMRQELAPGDAGSGLDLSRLFEWDGTTASPSSRPSPSKSAPDAETERRMRQEQQDERNWLVRTVERISGEQLITDGEEGSETTQQESDENPFVDRSGRPRTLSDIAIALASSQAAETAGAQESARKETRLRNDAADDAFAQLARGDSSAMRATLGLASIDAPEERRATSRLPEPRGGLPDMPSDFRDVSGLANQPDFGGEPPSRGLPSEFSGLSEPGDAPPRFGEFLATADASEPVNLVSLMESLGEAGILARNSGDGSIPSGSGGAQPTREFTFSSGLDSAPSAPADEASTPARSGTAPADRGQYRPEEDRLRKYLPQFERF